MSTVCHTLNPSPPQTQNVDTTASYWLYICFRVRYRHAARGRILWKYQLDPGSHTPNPRSIQEGMARCGKLGWPRHPSWHHMFSTSQDVCLYSKLLNALPETAESHDFPAILWWECVFTSSVCGGFVLQYSGYYDSNPHKTGVLAIKIPTLIMNSKHHAALPLSNIGHIYGPKRIFQVILWW